MKTYLACLGTRAEIVKIAALHRVLTGRGERVIVLHTGHHESVVDMLYRFFHMGPDLQLGSRQQASRQGERTALLLDGVDALVERVQPDVVLVQGGTATALVGALSGGYHGIPVAHIEAGRHTVERESIPTGITRALVGRLARWHFTPTAHARDQLLREGIDPGRVAVVGDTGVDTAHWTRQLLNGDPPRHPRVMPPGLAAFLGAHPGQRLLLVVTDPLEHGGPPMHPIAETVGLLMQMHEDLVVVWPLHPNATLCRAVESLKEGLKPGVSERLCLPAPVDYLTLITLLELCHCVLTDSQGIRDEALALGRPVLGGSDVASMAERAAHILRNGAAYRALQLPAAPMGDGRAADRIADILVAEA